MSNLKEFYAPTLKSLSISEDRFRELLLRLLDYGILCRNENQTEQQYYDVYLRTQALVNDYFEWMGIRILHDSRFQTVRLLPPGAVVPGVEDESTLPFSGGLRSRLTQAEVAMVLALRAEYEKALREGQIDDAGCVRLSLEALALSMKNVVGRPLSDNLTERKNQLRRLRQLRLVDVNLDDILENSDGWLKIRPMIISFVSDDVLAGLMQADDDHAQSGDTDNEEKSNQEKQTPKSESQDVHEDDH
ncbi:DUF4194 domain-containing protein [Marinibactrum halimedae]|uniref:DUF4194 domain-containing protein n=1 Tax=Marinibactrum halimedae TaxID=1444977 RepID=A0AA37T7P5_9GAMM|nr:DUF4194 domain-containing protein [Marinibactrum halimedae]MCD9460573.1 DUF4194 domain-containing protein [Marinibactrum halimedae]GLS27204.1 hypothetical protein GCM10007877_29230 [Marinibactrum halimedae]